MSFFVMLHDFARIGAKWEQMGNSDTENTLTDSAEAPQSRQAE